MESLNQNTKKSKPHPFTLQEQRGKWIARMFLPDGHRAAVTVGASTGPDKLTEERARETVRSWIERGLIDRLAAERKATPSKAKPVTLGDIADRWVTLIMKERDLAPSTRACHRTNAEGAIVKAFGDVEPEKLTTAMIRAWLRDLSHLSNSRVRNLFFTLSKMIDDALAEGWIALPLNPCRAREVQRALPALEVPADDEKAHHSAADVARILSSDAIPEERRMRYALAFATGLRDGELAGLRWSDLVEVHGVPCVWVRGALRLIGEEGTPEWGKTKTRSSVRKVALCPPLVEMLQAWRESGWEAFTGRKPDDRDPVLPDASGRPSRPPSAELFREDLVAVGLPDTFEGQPFEFRSTRSTFTTALASLGVDGELAERLLGHSEKSVRGRHYANNATPEMFARLHAAVTRLGNAFWQRFSEGGSDVAGFGPEVTETLAESSEPPSRIELETYGLRIRAAEGEGLRSVENSTSAPPATDHSARSQVPVAVGVAAPVATVEEALASAILGATKAGRWDVVAQLARELEARRLEGSNVVPLAGKVAR